MMCLIGVCHAWRELYRAVRAGRWGWTYGRLLGCRRSHIGGVVLELLAELCSTIRLLSSCEL
eukprot:365920-Chlamydomonas_euryale.AAC.13